MFSQLLCTGKLIMSKTQTADEAMQNATLHRLNQIIKDRGSSRVFGDDVCRKDWDDLTDDDFESFASCGYQLIEHEREFMQHGRVFCGRLWRISVQVKTT